MYENFLENIVIFDVRNFCAAENPCTMNIYCQTLDFSFASFSCDTLAQWNW